MKTRRLWLPKCPAIVSPRSPAPLASGLCVRSGCLAVNVVFSASDIKPMGWQDGVTAIFRPVMCVLCLPRRLGATGGQPVLGPRWYWRWERGGRGSVTCGHGSREQSSVLMSGTKQVPQPTASVTIVRVWLLEPTPQPSALEHSLHSLHSLTTLFQFL